MDYSFLIPVKDYDVEPLVKSLIASCERTFTHDDFEIIIAEDGSSAQNSQKNSVFKHACVQHLVRDKSMGRAAARNFLAHKASGEKLVFIDADSLVPENYAESYKSAFQHEKAEVIVGGTRYEDRFAGSDRKLRLHYGKKREEIPPENRMKNPYHGFTANNFAVDKEVFQSIKFDESITGYGHEDTVFGIELKRKKIKIVHINNPVVHTGLEDDEVFLKKTKEGAENLWKLWQQGKIEFSESKLLRFYGKNIAVVKVLSALPRIEKLLYSRASRSNPDLFSFDLLKLLWLHRAAQKPL